MNHINLQELKSKVDVVKLLQHYGFKKIEDSGSWVKAVCQYHADQNPSFGMRKGDTQFHCFGCQTSGDAIKLVMDMDKVDFTEAINKLAGMCGYCVTEDARLEYLRKKYIEPEVTDTKLKESETLIKSPRLIDLNWWAKFFFESSMPHSIAESYIIGRGFTHDVIQNFDLGYYDPNAHFIEEAYCKKYTEQELIAAGFLTPNGERFTNRLMFPIFDLNNDVLAFSGRAITPEQEPKYTATPNSDYWKKGFYLFGLQKVRQHEDIILVEGNLDCIRLQMFNLNALATLGTALTTNQCKLVKSLTEGTVTLLYDGDAAGVRAALHNVPLLMEQGVYVKVAMLPNGYDPDTFVKEFGVSTLEQNILKNSINAVQCTKDLGMVKHLKIIQKIKDEQTRDCYISQACDVFGISEQSLKLELKKVY